ncbi:MAG: hypothetical protein RL572_1217 [Pseudomonadota bacterium]|jgi:hypothetical protein
MTQIRNMLLLMSVPVLTALACWAVWVLLF